jgi:stearoyl-CoA desaturase (delta-9 desaturase)
MKLTGRNFFILTLVSHLAFFSVMLFGTLLQATVVFLIFCFITLFSSTIIYHRLLSHRSWKCPAWYEKVGTAIGIFSFTGTPVTRTLAHRYHHAYSDTNQDPHSPRAHGIFYAYFPMLRENKLNPRIVRDILENKFHRFIHENYLKIIIATILIASVLFGVWWTTVLFIAPGALCWMNISLCNIMCHWGAAGDDIKQNRVLAFLTFGEGYHRHHHDNPNDPNFGNGQFDIGFYAIKIIEKINGYLQRI